MSTTTPTGSLSTVVGIDKLVLGELVRFLIDLDDDRATAEMTDDGAVQVDVVLGTDSGLSTLALVVDPVSWLPTAVTGSTPAGAETTLDLAWDSDCPPGGPAQR